MSPPAYEGQHKPLPTGRRNLGELDLPEERIESADPVIEAPRLGTDDTCKLIARAPKYRVCELEPVT
ncbi:MAG TPA: hypothetical protein VFP84_33110 [Kofleriaceae bacterium]|nr:hypothetical protein [Kofleriaceae bacterium]